MALRPAGPRCERAARVTFSDAGAATTTVEVGPRFHFRLGKHGWVHPGISFVRAIDARGLDAPLITAQASAVQLDVPVTVGNQRSGASRGADGQWR